MNWWTWIIIGLGLFAIELALPMDFFFIFFGLSFVATGGLVFSGLIPHESTQYVVCALLSLLFLFFLKPKLQSKLSTTQAKEDFVNEDIIPYEDIEVGAVGKGELRGSSWGVVNKSQGVLVKGKRYKVSKIDNLQAVVE